MSSCTNTTGTPAFTSALVLPGIDWSSLVANLPRRSSFESLASAEGNNGDDDDHSTTDLTSNQTHRRRQLHDIIGEVLELVNDVEFDEEEQDEREADRSS